MRTAAVLNKMNSEKRLLHNWLLKTKKKRYIDGKATTMRLFQEKKVAFDKWRSKSKSKFLLNKFLNKWRQKLIESKTGLGISTELLKTRLKEACLQLWQRKLHLVRSSEEKLAIYKRINADHCKAKAMFKIIKLLKHQSQRDVRILEWRKNIKRRNILNLMRYRTRQLAAGAKHYASGLKYGALLAWRNSLRKLEYSKENKSKLFATWKKCAIAKRGLKNYLKTNLLNRIVSYHPSNAIWEQMNTIELESFGEMNGLGNVTRCFLHWKHRSRKQRKLRTLQKEFIDSRNLKLFQRWQSEALLKSAHRREPCILKTFFLQKWKASLNRLNEEEEARRIRLADYQVGREYISLYMAFKRWEQVFEVKKIEEHLCDQNLIVWDMREKEIYFKKLRFETLIRIFKKFGNQITRKEYFEKWQDYTKQEEEERVLLVSGRFFEQWRRQLEISRANKVARTFAKRKLERCFIKFKRVIKTQSQFNEWAKETYEVNLTKRYFNLAIKFYRLKKNTLNDDNPFVYSNNNCNSSSVEEQVVTTQPLISLSVHNQIRAADEETRLTEWFGNGQSAFDETSNDIFFTPIKSA
jgi:hypothetical protein